MTPSERRSEILRLLCKRRHETAINLATEFGVSERTIRNDLVILPVITRSKLQGVDMVEGLIYQSGSI